MRKAHNSKFITQNSKFLLHFQLFLANFAKYEQQY